MRINATSTTDPDSVRVSDVPVSPVSHCCPGSWCLHRRRRHHEDPRHQHRARVFCITASDQQRATGSSSARLAHTGPSSGTSDHQVIDQCNSATRFLWVLLGICRTAVTVSLGLYEDRIDNTGVTKWPYAIGWCWWCSYGRMVPAIFRKHT